MNPSIITFEGELTELERKSLSELRNTEPFRLLRKILGQEYAKVSFGLATVGTDRALTLGQGQLLGILGIYNLLMTLGISEKEVQPLPKYLQVLEDGKKRGSRT